MRDRLVWIGIGRTVDVTSQHSLIVGWQERVEIDGDYRTMSVRAEMQA